MYVSQGVDVRRENKLETYERKEIINETKFGQIQENGIKCVSRGINLGMGYKFICLLIEWRAVLMKREREILKGLKCESILTQ